MWITDLGVIGHGGRVEEDQVGVGPRGDESPVAKA
jgi:hypothetical protein